MKCLRLVAAALSAASLAAAEVKVTPPPAANKSPALPVGAVVLLPDLTIKAKPVGNGLGPVYNFVIENVGKVPSKETSVRYYAVPPCTRPADIGDGKLIGALPVKALVVTTSPSYAFGVSVQMPEALRGCRLKAVVDLEHAVLESNENNNEAWMDTERPPRADLTVWVTRGEPGKPDKATVENIGNAPSPPCVLQISCYAEQRNGYWPCGENGPRRTWNIPVPRLDPWKKFEMMPPVSVGDKDVWFKVDVNNQVDEWIEGNNGWPGPPQPY